VKGKKLGVVMDPIASIHYKKDSTLAMLEAASARGYELYYFEQQDLFIWDSIPFGRARSLTVFNFNDTKQWFKLGAHTVIPLAELAVILMRKDPPVDSRYIYTTYLLELAEQLGVLVVNRARALRDANEKLFAAYFPSCTPPTIVTHNKEQLWEFWREHSDIVLKPLNSMGGTSVFRLSPQEVNANVIFDTLTQNETMYVMGQKFIPEIIRGDKRIIMINGEPIPYALARVPQENDWRGNLAAGAKGIVQSLSRRDQFICEQVGPVLKERGLYFVGLDVIGDYLTEINVTSPTGIRELEAEIDVSVTARLFDVIEEGLK
jgi:glutathione synthase